MFSDSKRECWSIYMRWQCVRIIRLVKKIANLFQVDHNFLIFAKATEYAEYNTSISLLTFRIEFFFLGYQRD